ncbi:MAG TPA: FecR family protein [Polyangiales bacterium]
MSELDRPLKRALHVAPSPVRVEAMWQQIEARRAGRSRSVGSTTWLWAGAGSFALVFAIMFILGRQHLLSSAAVGVPVARGELTLPAQLADARALSSLDASRADAQVTLSDASRVVLQRGGKLVTRSSGGTLLALDLVQGFARFDVTPHGPRRWQIAAGAVQVEVLGTSFSVQRTAAQVRVAVERGLVRVSGPGVPSGEQRLAAQQALVVTQPLTQAAGAATAVEHDSRADQPVAAEPSLAGAAPVADGAWRAAIQRAVSAHQYARAYAVLGAAGYTRGALAARPVADLLMLADVARLSGHVREATLPLIQITEHHADDARAALAALTLGRIFCNQLSEPVKAAAAFELALALGLPDGLAEDGQARVVEAYVKSNRMQLARQAAVRYRARFPHGQQRAKVDAWAGTR